MKKGVIAKLTFKEMLDYNVNTDPFTKVWHDEFTDTTYLKFVSKYLPSTFEVADEDSYLIVDYYTIMNIIDKVRATIRGPRLSRSWEN